MPKTPTSKFEQLGTTGGGSSGSSDIVGFAAPDWQGRGAGEPMKSKEFLHPYIHSPRVWLFD
jgi:hypothetical protein